MFSEYDQCFQITCQTQIKIKKIKFYYFQKKNPIAEVNTCRFKVEELKHAFFVQMSLLHNFISVSSVKFININSNTACKEG